MHSVQVHYLETSTSNYLQASSLLCFMRGTSTTCKGFGHSAFGQSGPVCGVGRAVGWVEQRRPIHQRQMVADCSAADAGHLFPAALFGAVGG